MERDEYTIRKLVGRPSYWIKFRSPAEAESFVKSLSFVNWYSYVTGPSTPYGVLFHIFAHGNQEDISQPAGPATLLIGGKGVTIEQMREVAELSIKKRGQFVKAFLPQGNDWAELADTIMNTVGESEYLEMGVLKPKSGKFTLLIAILIVAAMVLAWFLFLR